MAAFAILIKYNHLTHKFTELVDEVDNISSDLEEFSGNQKM